MRAMQPVAATATATVVTDPIASSRLDQSVLDDLRCCSAAVTKLNNVVFDAIKEVSMMQHLSSSSTNAYISSSSSSFSSSFPTVLKLSEIESKPIHNIKWISSLLQDTYASIKEEYINCAKLMNETRSTYSSGSKIHTDRICKSVNKGGIWEVNYFMEEGVWNDDLCAICPVTSAMLRSLPICESSLGYVYFSVIKPGTHITPHYGCSNCKLRIQLPLFANSDCKIIIDGEAFAYENGKPLIFDDSFLHEVEYKKSSDQNQNQDQDQDRVVLLIDIWNPELSPFATNCIINSFPPCNKVVDGCHQLGAYSASCSSSSSSSSSACSSSNSGKEETFNETHTATTTAATTISGGSRDVIFQKDPVSIAPRVSATGDILNPREYDYLFKYLLVGTNNVGKSCLLLRFADSTYTNSYMSTIGVDFKIRTISLEDKTVKLQIWDTAGPERFKTITSSYYRGAHGVFLLYDVSDRDSFKDIQFWYSESLKNCSPGCMLVLVGCKSDLNETPTIEFNREIKREVSYESGLALSREMNIPFFECSSKMNINVEAPFLEMSSLILGKINNDHEYLQKMKTNSSAKSNADKKWCSIS